MKWFFWTIRVFYIFVGMWVVCGWYYYEFIRTPITTNTTVSNIEYETISTGSLSQSITVVWSAELTDEQELKFNKTGKVTNVYIKEWDTVKKDQLLATLDQSQALINIEQQQLSLKNAQLKLADLYEPLDDSKIMEYEKNITQARENLDTAKKELALLLKTQATELQDIETNISYKKRDITLTEKSLSDTQKSYEVTSLEQKDSLSTTEINVQNTKDNIVLDFQKNLTTIEEGIEDIDYILWYTEANEDKNNSYEIYLSAKNVQIKNQAEIYFWQALIAYQKAKWADTSDLESLLVLENDMYTTLLNAADYTYQAIENSVESSTLSQTEIDSKKSNMSSLRSKMQSGLTSVLSYQKQLSTLTDVDLLKTSQEISLEKTADSITSIQNNLEKYKNDLTTLEENLAQTLEDHKIKLTSKQNSITSLEKSLNIAEITYKEALEWPTESNVQNIKNEIKKAELTLSDAQKELENYELRAPFAWVIRKIDLKVGDNLVTDNSKYIYIENPDLIEIPVMLDQVDIVKVSLWQKATITFDAYPTEPIIWEISHIDYTPVESSGVVSYTIKIVMVDPNFTKKILSWMTCDIEIETLSKENIILVSTKALTTSDDKTYVNVQKGPTTEKVEVTIWLAADGKTEVLSWLNVWDKIVISQIQASTKTDTSTSNSLISLPTWNTRWSSSWWGWWMPPGWF